MPRAKSAVIKKKPLLFLGDKSFSNLEKKNAHAYSLQHPCYQLFHGFKSSDMLNCTVPNESVISMHIITLLKWFPGLLWTHSVPTLPITEICFSKFAFPLKTDKMGLLCSRCGGKHARSNEANGRRGLCVCVCVFGGGVWVSRVVVVGGAGTWDLTTRVNSAN